MTTTGPRLSHSTAYETSRQFSDAPVTLHGLVGYNSGSAQFIQLHDSATTPAESAIPVITFAVAAASNFSLAAAMRGLRFSNGLYVCNSSTGPTKTLGSADCFFTANIE